ncbi:hypothetical protein [Desulfovibrio ferrophilus]|uniref:Major facilitator superfamily permease n=1 Tax=Desulfovibrio ferrophilus TaxID=241368 RepID=A0A2Z6AYR3_9BACT|nr:hypothetical protein [Desulfovibrio ferrophilus]BBD08296.1 major facilitator superfamily permease [Desulfovibrio ferrophilus]
MRRLSTAAIAALTILMTVAPALARDPDEWELTASAGGFLYLILAFFLAVFLWQTRNGLPKRTWEGAINIFYKRCKASEGRPGFYEYLMKGLDKDPKLPR